MEKQLDLAPYLADILDPETGASVLDLGVVRDVRVADRSVTILIDGSHVLARHFAHEAEAAARDAVPEGWTVAVALA